MSATITAADGSGTTVPMTVLSPYETAWEARSVVHDLIGGGIAVSLVAPRLRSGDLALLYGTEAEAYACATLHRSETTFTLTETERPAVSMTYVVAGSGVVVALDEASLTAWIVTVGFQEVTL
jgi:hypothetical protein